MTFFPELLICDQDIIFRLGIAQKLKLHFICYTASNIDEAMHFLQKHSIDIILLDIRMEQVHEKFPIIKKFLAINPTLAILISTLYTDFSTIREAMQLGAIDYIAKDFEIEAILYTIERVLEHKKLLQRQNQQNFEALIHQNQYILIGTSHPIQELRKKIKEIRQNSAHVLITGEIGTGKELVARQLRGIDSEGKLLPFITIDLAMMQNPDDQDGHSKNNETISFELNNSIKRIFEKSYQGILYFDEISHMSPQVQTQFLQFLEKKAMKPKLRKTLQLECQIICATNQTSEEKTPFHAFKSKFIQRPDTIVLSLPPLRERIEDLPLLIDHFIKKHCSTRPLKVTPYALELMQAYPWPGNVRELNNLIAHFATTIEGDKIDVIDLPKKFKETIQNALIQREAQLSCSFYEKISHCEKILLEKEIALCQTSQTNLSELATKLKMDRSHLYTKLKEHGLYTPKHKKKIQSVSSVLNK